MNTWKVWAALAVLLIVAGCATEKIMVPIGGSRADGTVNLAFEYGMFEAPHVDVAAATVTAAQRCKAWGYTSAEPFGGQQNKCELSNQYGCIRTMVTVTFQCTGTPPAR